MDFLSLCPGCGSRHLPPYTRDDGAHVWCDGSLAKTIGNVGRGLVGPFGDLAPTCKRRYENVREYKPYTFAGVQVPEGLPFDYFEEKAWKK